MTSANDLPFKSSQIKTINRRPRITTLAVNITITWDVKDRKHCSGRVGDGLPGVATVLSVVYSVTDWVDYLSWFICSLLGRDIFQIINVHSVNWNHVFSVATKYNAFGKISSAILIHNI